MIFNITRCKNLGFIGDSNNYSGIRVELAKKTFSLCIQHCKHIGHILVFLDERENGSVNCDRAFSRFL